MENTNQPIKKLLLDINDVKAITGFCTTTIYKYVKNGKFPEPKRCDDRSVRWRLSDIENYVNS